MPSMKEMFQLVRLLGRDPATLGDDEYNRLFREFTENKNATHERAFAASPPSERIVLIPQCMRRFGPCAAVETEAGYDCAECMACAAGPIWAEARRLGYRGVYMLKGGRAVKRLLDEVKPAAVLGVACDYEGAIGMLECERGGAVVRFVALTKDGCSSTEVDLDEVLRVMAEGCGG